MSVSISAFRDVSAISARGFVKADGPDGLKQFGDSKLFGSIGKASGNAGETANIALRGAFVAALKAEYGESFANYQAAKLQLDGGQPLSLKEVRTAIAEGDAKRQAKTEIVAKAASTFVGQFGLETAREDPLGGGVPGLKDVVGDKLLQILTQVNTNAAKNETGLSLKLSDLVPGQHAERLDGGMRHGIAQAHGDAMKASALTLDAAKDIAASVVKNDGPLKALIATKIEVLAELEKLDLKGADKDYATADILKGNFATLGEFLARSGRSGAASKAQAHLPQSSETRNLKNVSLETVFGNVGKGSVDPKKALADVKVQGSPFDREFHMNREVLGHFADKVKDTNPKLAETLGHRALGHMIRFASSKLQGDTRHENPLVAAQVIYSRGGGTQLTQTLTKSVANALGVDAGQIVPVTDGRVIEVIRRDFESKNIGSAFSLDGLSAEDQGKALYDIVRTCLNAKDPVFLDVTSFMSGTMRGHDHDPAELKDALKIGDEFLHTLIDATIEDFVTQHNKDNPGAPIDAAKTRATVREHLTLGSIISVGGQDVLYTSMAAGSTNNPGNPKQTMTSLFTGLVGHNGFTVGPNQLLENWVEALTPKGDATGGLASLSGKFMFPQTGIDFAASTASLRDIGTVPNLVGTDTAKAFAALGGKGSAAEKILPNIALAMLKKLDEQGMHAAFQKAGVPELENYLLNHIEAQMAVAVEASNTGNQTGLIDALELIQADIGTLTAIAAPYGEGAFQTAMERNWTAANLGAPEGVSPKFSITNSGMRGLASVLSGVETMIPGDRRLNVAIAQNSYYESAGNLGSGRRHQTFEMSDTDPSTSMAGFAKLKGQGEKLDLLVTEFHHNIGMGVSEYRPVPVADQIKSLLGSENVSGKLTVAIDDTISVPNGSDMKTLLQDPVIAAALKDGKLNIVTYRSAQKFDMAGYDNYNGGIVNVLNNGSFASFEKGMANTGGESDNVSNVNRQGLTLFQDAAGPELAAYRQGVMANTAVFTSLLGDEDLLRGAHRGQKFLQFTPNGDPSAVFVDVRSAMLSSDDADSEALYAGLQGIYMRLGQNPNNQLTVATRPSFGFAHSNVSVIGADRFRFNPGLEKSSDMASYKAVIDQVNVVYRGIEQSMPETARDGRSPAKQTRDFVSRLASSSVQSDVELATVARALGPDPRFDDLASAAKILKANGINNLAFDLAQKAQMLSRTPQELDASHGLMDSIGKPVHATPSNFRQALTELTATVASGVKDPIRLREVVSRLEALRADATRDGPVPGSDLRSVVFFAVSGLQHLDRNALTELSTGLSLTAGLYPASDPHGTLAAALSRAVDDLSKTRNPVAAVSPGSVRSAMADLAMSRGVESPRHAFGELTTGANSVLKLRFEQGLEGTAQQPTGLVSPFGTNATMNAVFAAVSRVYAQANDLTLSPQAEKALGEVGKRIGPEYGTAPDALGTGVLKAFVAQGYMRNMQTMMPPIFDAIARTDLNDPKSVATAEGKLRSLAGELEKNVAVQSGSLHGMIGLLTDPRLLDALPPADRQKIDDMGRGLMTLQGLVEARGGLVDGMADFASQLRRDPVTVMTEIKTLLT